MRTTSSAPIRTLWVAELEQRGPRVWRAYSKSCKKSEKQERYAHEQYDLLRALEDLAATERAIRAMYETSQSQRSRHDRRPRSPIWWCGPAIAIFLWVRRTVSVELRPFNDRQYNRNLLALCQRVNERQVRLPDGRLLEFSVKENCHSILHGSKDQLPNTLQNQPTRVDERFSAEH